MKRLSKCLILIVSILLVSACAFPFQSSKYPTWETKGVLESYTLIDGRSIDGWVGANIGETISAKWYDFTINYVEELDSYEGYDAQDGKKLVHANITITNTSEKEVYIFSEDFALIWNLESSDRSYATSLAKYTDTMIDDKETPVAIGETKTIDTVYEIDESVKKPMAIYYYEQYSDGQKGNKYYVYVK